MASHRSATATEPDATVADLLSEVLAAGRRRLVEHAVRIPAGGDDEDVHQARVATRQLRSLLKSVREVLDRSWVRGMRTELAWLGETLGAVRDADVLTMRLEAALRELGALGEGARTGGNVLVRRLAEQRQPAAEALRETLETPRYHALVAQLAIARERPPLVTPGTLAVRDLAPTWVRAAWHQQAAAVSVFENAQSDHALHQVRISAKRLRYLCEAVSPVVGEPASRLGQAASRLQDVLGEFQDAVVAEQWLRQALPDCEDTAGDVVGQLIARERRIQHSRRDEWLARWSRLREQHQRYWTTS